MLFNSLQFLVFFPLVTLIYFFIPYKFRWLHLLLASCVFYMAFIPVYIFILVFTIVIDYFAGILIERAPQNKKRMFLNISIIANLGVLAIFKYYNFFTENVNVLLHSFNIATHTLPYLDIILPVGLSFHTFQAMSYTIEIYRGNQKTERHFGIYALYVMFYPQLVAGPIERPQNLLHQFREKYDFDYSRVVSGLQLMIWGLFKKVVIADRLALLSDGVYSDHGATSGFTSLVGVLAFAFQIYCDFSGYSDIALGSAKVMGFTLMKNFNNPFISQSMTEFWRRWHISLSTWFNDYLFTPMVHAKREWGKPAVAGGIFITFFLSGLWHGASWTYVIWGVLNGLALIYEFLTRKIRKKLFSNFPSGFSVALSIFLMFSFNVFCWIFFRAHSVSKAFDVMGSILHTSSFSLDFSSAESFNFFSLGVSACMLIYLFLVEIKPEGILRNLIGNEILFSVLNVSLICALGVFNRTSFIYFQF